MTYGMEAQGVTVKETIPPYGMTSYTEKKFFKGV
eukprot:CAMPEP_0168313500 /NCGR_PEP_ID=MMETSP0210-20121227/2356_1 /TAXON_ID=40633 /ORGANISM="Condylostoma magnum, Strain COL2" /LENGTH=33 /DNA_ID= /DNA_START= /DNA_END= /DNA_ORIENTATION=